MFVCPQSKLKNCKTHSSPAITCLYLLSFSSVPESLCATAFPGFTCHDLSSSSWRSRTLVRSRGSWTSSVLCLQVRWLKMRTIQSLPHIIPLPWQSLLFLWNSRFNCIYSSQWSYDYHFSNYSILLQVAWVLQLSKPLDLLVVWIPDYSIYFLIIQRQVLWCVFCLFLLFCCFFVCFLFCFLNDQCSCSKS